MKLISKDLECVEANTHFPHKNIILPPSPKFQSAHDPRKTKSYCWGPCSPRQKPGPQALCAVMTCYRSKS